MAKQMAENTEEQGKKVNPEEIKKKLMNGIQLKMVNKSLEIIYRKEEAQVKEEQTDGQKYALQTKKFLAY